MDKNSEKYTDNAYMDKYRIEPIDNTIYEKAMSNWDSIAKPIGGLGEFEKIVCRIAAITGREYPDISRRALIIMCADNGVVEEGVSQTTKEVTRQVTELMTDRKSSVGIMAAGSNIDTCVVDIGVDSDPIPGTINKKIARGTKNFLFESAMTKKQCLEAVETGIEMVKNCRENGYSIIVTGEMGIGNTTTSTALMCALTGISPDIITGAGAGLSEVGIQRKKEVIKKGLEKYNLGCGAACAEEAYEAMCKLGGFDIAGLVGVYIGGALCHMPVIIDGFISAVAALTAEKICPGVKEYMIASHSGRESGTQKALDILGLKPVIYADMALGEGTGAIMLLPLLDMAFRLYKSGTGFDETDIESYERFDK